ncbi:hypothetical protein TWF694_001943 [Orbilia ellipsospora]|uniref:Uncharacterized protein n=1 Tax=Orbilia ellipsospora TaxID=2528407 RepID=A0AAV9X457_9PEZI
MAPSGVSRRLATKKVGKPTTLRNTLKERVLQRKQGDTIDDAPDSSLWEIDVSDKRSKEPLSRSPNAPLNRGTRDFLKGRHSAETSKKLDDSSIWDIPPTQEDVAAVVKKKAEARPGKVVEPKPNITCKKTKPVPKKKSGSEDEYVPMKPKARSTVSKKTTSQPAKNISKVEISTMVESISSWSSSDHNDTIDGKTLVEESRMSGADQKVDDDNTLQKIAAAAIDQLPNSQQLPMLRVSQSGIIKASAVPRDAPARKYSPPSPTEAESNFNEKTGSPIQIPDSDGEVDSVLILRDEAKEENEITTAPNKEDKVIGIDLENESVKEPEIIIIEEQSSLQSSSLQISENEDVEDMLVERPELLSTEEQTPLQLSPLQISEDFARMISSISNIHETPKHETAADAFRSPEISIRLPQSQEDIIPERTEDESEVEVTGQSITALATPYPAIDQNGGPRRPKVYFEKEEVRSDLPHISPLRTSEDKLISIRPFPKLQLEKLRSPDTQSRKVFNPSNADKIVHDNRKPVGDISADGLRNSKIQQQNIYFDGHPKPSKDSGFLSKSATEVTPLNTEITPKQSYATVYHDTNYKNKATTVNDTNKNAWKQLQGLGMQRVNPRNIRRRVEEMVAGMKHKMEEEEQEASNKQVRGLDKRRAKKRRMTTSSPYTRWENLAEGAPQVEAETRAEFEKSYQDEQESSELYKSLEYSTYTESSSTSQVQKPAHHDIITNSAIMQQLKRDHRLQEEELRLLTEKYIIEIKQKTHDAIREFKKAYEAAKRDQRNEREKTFDRVSTELVKNPTHRYDKSRDFYRAIAFKDKPKAQELFLQHENMLARLEDALKRRGAEVDKMNEIEAQLQQYHDICIELADNLKEEEYYHDFMYGVSVYGEAYMKKNYEVPVDYKPPKNTAGIIPQFDHLSKSITEMVTNEPNLTKEKEKFYEDILRRGIARIDADDDSDVDKSESFNTESIIKSKPVRQKGANQNRQDRSLHRKSRRH